MSVEGWSLRGKRSSRDTCDGRGSGGNSGAALMIQVTAKLIKTSSRTAGAPHSNTFGVTLDTLKLPSILWINSPLWWVGQQHIESYILIISSSWTTLSYLNLNINTLIVYRKEINQHNNHKSFYRNCSSAINRSQLLVSPTFCMHGADQTWFKGTDKFFSPHLSVPVWVLVSILHKRLDCY